MRVAIIEKNAIENIIVSDKVEEGQIDVTDIPCNIGDPLDELGKPIFKPSIYYTVKSDNSGWEITSENQALMDSENDEKNNSNAKRKLETIDNKSIEAIRKFLIDKFGDDELMPKDLKDFETEAEAERVKIIK